MAWKSKRSDDLEAFRDITDDVEESEFVPYASLLDPHTVITKNGELLQTIRISGLSYENPRQESFELRRALRAAIREHIPDNSFALWFHTVRLETDLSLETARATEFARELSGKWNEKNRFKRQFANVVYVTIVHEGQDAAILSPQVFMRGLFPRFDLKWRNGFIDDTVRKLDAVAGKIAAALEPFGASRLGIVKRDGVYESEMIRFLNKIINFVDTPMPVTDVDLSEVVTSGEITFSYNAMEVRAVDGRRRFAALLTLKEYKEKSLPFIDRFLKLPIEFIVTQCASFVDPEKAAASYRKQKAMHDLGEEDDLPRLAELNDILASDTGKPNDFGEQQLSIFIIADSVRQLERNLKHGINFLARHGIVCFREDLKFEECYWAQMPGNFEFVSRMQPTPTIRIAGFANLYNHPVGLRDGNRWGSAVTTLHTANGAPYFFNFHVGEAGHTLIVGKPETDRGLLVNFLVAESTRFSPRIVYFDPANRQLSLVERLEGETHQFSAQGEGPPVALNPFSLSPTEGNRRFLARWLSVLLRSAGQALADADKPAITDSLEKLYAAAGPRSLSRYLDLMAAAHPASAAKFAAWRKGGPHGHLFDHEDDLFDGAGRIHGLHLAEALAHPTIAPALLSYLFQKATDCLDGTPAILVLDEAWTLIGQTHVAAELGGWLDHLTSRNALALFTTQHIEDAALKPFTPAIVEKAVTQIYFPDTDPDEAYMEKFGLNELEYSYLDVIETGQHHLLMKRMENTIIAEFDLDGMDAERAILAGEETAETESYWSEKIG